MIVRFGDRVMSLMSGNRSDPGGIPFEHERSQILRQLNMELDELDSSLFPKLDCTVSPKNHLVRSTLTVLAQQ